MILLKILFWVSFTALLHTYILYPLLLKLLAIRKKNNQIVFEAADEFPFVSIIIPAHNEETVIKEKLLAIFDTKYPKNKIEILVGSDASTDKTDEIVKEIISNHAAFNGELIQFKERSGKPKIVNTLVQLAKNEILVLTDANVIFEKNMLYELMKHFKNPGIALVDTRMINTIRTGGGISKAESTYIHGEVEIKNNEGKIFGKMIGPFGGCYAIRKSFYSPIPESFLVDDFYINMKVLERGGKSISETNARVYEKAQADWKIEFVRKIRIATGSFQNLFTFSHLLLKFNSLSFCFLSHKVLRWFGPFFMITLYVTNLCILLKTMHFQESQTGSYLIIFTLQNLLLILFIFDLILVLLKIYFTPARLLSHFLSTNLALLIGFFRFLSGVRNSIWQPTKR